MVRGHWKRNHWIDHTRFTKVELFDVEYYRGLEMWVRGHALKIIEIGTI